MYKITFVFLGIKIDQIKLNLRSYKNRFDYYLFEKNVFPFYVDNMESGKTMKNVNTSLR